MDPIAIRVATHLEFLAPWDCDVLRVGGLRDGGYVVGTKSLERAGSLLSLGIASEWSFDSDFLSRRPDVSYIACDRSSGALVHLVGAIRSTVRLSKATDTLNLLRRSIHFSKLVPPLSLSRRRRFVRKWVRAAVVDSGTEVSFLELVDALRTTRPIFLKMDIEGGEYELLPLIAEVVKITPETFCGFCIEFHKVGTRLEEIRHFLKRLGLSFAIVHLHANNCSPLVNGFPDTIEVTLAPRTDIRSQQITELPRRELDVPNSSVDSDYILHFRFSSRPNQFEIVNR